MVFQSLTYVLEAWWNFPCMLLQFQATVRADPSDIQFSEMKTDERSSIGEATVSLIWGKIFICSNYDID